MQSIKLGLFLNTFILVGLVVLINGCQAPSSDWNSSEGFKTQIISARTQGTEFLQVELVGVLDKKTLSGEVVQFYFSPGEEGNKILGESPIARFVKNSKGVHIPADIVTLQMVTIYYHLQELKKLEVESAGHEVVKWPRKVGLKVRTINPEMRNNNAYYNTQTDMLYFVPYTNTETPIALNKGVVAHEHFHSYFANKVIKPAGRHMDITKYNAAANATEAEYVGLLLDDLIIKSLNEGLADYWGWIYSNDPDFVALSLPRFSESRSLSKMTRSDTLPSLERLKLDTQSIIRNPKIFCPNNPDVLACISGLAYLRGTTIARILKEFAYLHQARQGLSSEELRSLMAKKVISLLESIYLQASGNTLSLENSIVAWSRLFNNLTELECDHLKKSVSSNEAKEKICSAN